MTPIILDPSNPEIPATLGPVQRILRGVPATLSHTFYTDGSAIDPGSATVSITRVSDGLVIADEAATSEDDPGVFSYTLTPADTSLLDTLLVSWNATISGHATSLGGYVEIVGGFLFTVAEARALGLAEADYGTADLVAARTRVEQRLERALGVAFVPRYRHGETIIADGGASLLLAMPKVRMIRSVTVDGTAFTAGELADLTIAPYLVTGRTWRGTVIVGYEHGWDQPEEPVRQEALRLARLELTSTPNTTDPRIASFSTDDGTVRYRDSGPGTVFAVDEAILRDYGMNVGVA